MSEQTFTTHNPGTRRHSGIVGGAILITIGLAGRLAALLLAFSLGLAVITGEAGASWRQREVATLYLTATLAILLLGCGRFALDAVVWKRFRKGGGSGSPKPKR